MSLRRQCGQRIGVTRSANSRAMMARRTAGRLGDGGGPGIRRGIFPRPRRALPGEAKVLQVGESHAGHQRVPVQAGPGSPLEVPEAQFLFELLMSLLAHPARLDGGGERAQRGPRRQVAEVVLALATRAPLAHQPDLVAGQVAVVRPGCTIADPDAGCRELRGQRALGALSPCHPAPGQVGQHRLGLARLLVRHRAPLASRGWDQLDVHAIDFLVAGDADRPGQAPLAQALPEGSTRAVAGIGQREAEPHAGGDQPVQLSQRDLALAAGHHLLIRHAGRRAARRIGGPLRRQEQPHRHGDRHLPPS